MNKLLIFIQKYLFNPRIILSLVALIFIWNLIPLLAEGYHIPLPQPLFELASTTALILYWLVYGAYSLLKSPLIKAAAQTPSIEKNARLALKTSFHRALNALQKSKPRYLRSRYQRPWILLMGPRSSGKSSLLDHTQLKLLHSNLSTQTSATWDWCLNEKAIFIDAPGKYSLPNWRDKHAYSLWGYFLKLIKGYRPQQPLSGILLVIDVPTLCQIEGSATDELIKVLKKQMLSLQHLKRSIPITLLIHKIDLMTGFNEFFSDLGIEERKQLLGFTLSPTHKAPEFQKNLHQQFNHLIAQMSQRLLWRLHQERSLSKRGKLKDFPLQLERLKPFIEKLVHPLPWSKELQLNGIYFASSMQQSSTLLLEHSTKANRPKNTAALTPKPYFVDGLLAHLSHASHYEEQYQLRKVWRRLGAYPTTAVILTAAALMMHYVYQKNVEGIREIQIGLSLLSSTPENAHRPNWITKLNTLNNALQRFDTQKNSPNYQLLGMGEASQLQNKAFASYHILLAQSLIPYLQETLIRHIESSIKHNKTYPLYSSLKTYLMLTQPEHMDPNYVTRWFTHRWALQFPHDESYQEQLKHHLNQMLHSQNAHFEEDPALVRKAQATLHNYPLSEQGFWVLEDQYSYEQQALLSQKHAIPGIDFSQASISNLYALNHFNFIYDQQIPDLLKKLPSEAWVLGAMESMPHSAEEEAQLIEGIRVSYLRHYASSWKKAIYSVQFTTPTDFKAAQEAMGNLANPHSTFWQLINIMVSNASINARYNKDSLDPNLASITRFITENTDFKTTQNLLGALSLYLNSMAQANDPNNAAYIAAIKHIQNKNPDDPISALLQQAQLLPPPLQNWLKSLTEGTWGLILARSADYLDYLYTTNVFPAYLLHINDGYPIFKDSSKNILIDDFSEFFKPQGTMDTFFNYYVKPFVNTSHFYWRWSKIDGKTLPISQAKLEMFLRANLIQKMFYSTQEGGELGIEFELKPESLSNSVKQFTLNIDGQMLKFNSHSSEPSVIHWPGPDSNFVTLRFETRTQPQPTETKTGPWAWFKVLDASTLETTPDAKEYKLSFELDKNTARYRLITPNVINPYLPNVLDKFRLSPSLLEESGVR